jgi:hypothetical protein
MARGDAGAMQLRQTIAVPGSITAMDAHLVRAGKYQHVVVGIHGENGSELLLYAGAHDGLSLQSRFSLTQDATAFAFGNLDGDAVTDILVLAGGQVSILHGGSQTLEPVSVSYTVSSIALGRFLPDRSSLAQMALLSSDGSVHILAHSNIDSRPLTATELSARSRVDGLHSAKAVAPVQQNAIWKEVDRVPGAANFSSGQAPQMFRTRISDNATDDVMLLGASGLSVVTHPDHNPLVGQVIDRSDLAADVVAAVPARVNIDGRPGVVFVQRGDTSPHAMMPLPDPTFYVNKFTDPTPTSPISNACNNTSATDTSSPAVCAKPS